MIKSCWTKCERDERIWGDKQLKEKRQRSHGREINEEENEGKEKWEEESGECKRKRGEFVVDIFDF